MQDDILQRVLVSADGNITYQAIIDGEDTQFQGEKALGDKDFDNLTFWDEFPFAYPPPSGDFDDMTKISS